MPMIVQKIHTDPCYLKLFDECREDVRWAERKAFQKGCEIFRHKAAGLLRKNKVGLIFLMENHDIRTYLHERDRWGWFDELKRGTYAVDVSRGLMTTQWLPELDGITCMPFMRGTERLSPHYPENIFLLAKLLQNLAHERYVPAIPPIPIAKE